MKKLNMILIAALVAAGCARHQPSPFPPEEPIRDVVLEEEAILEPEIVEIAPEPVTSERKELSWEDLQRLGFKYQVQAQDTLSAIARRYQVGTGLLARLNDIKDPDLIRVGRTLTVIQGPFRVEVDKSRRELSVHRGNLLIRSYPVALGIQGSTPEGEFEVLRKLVKPAWTDPYHRTVVTADRPEYPLGTRWIEFKAPPGAYGIHGTHEAKTIGEEASFGCVRLLHPAEEEVYDFVTLGSPVLIRP